MVLPENFPDAKVRNWKLIEGFYGNRKHKQPKEFVKKCYLCTHKKLFEMLGRRQIREKVVEAVYSYYQNPVKADVLEKNMFSQIDKIYHLYIYQLNFLVALKALAEKHIEIGKNKYIKTEDNLNPNQKFINNQVLNMLEEN